MTGQSGFSEESARQWLSWLDGQRHRDPDEIEPYEGTAYQAAQRVARRLSPNDETFQRKAA